MTCNSLYLFLRRHHKKVGVTPALRQAKKDYCEMRRRQIIGLASQNRQSLQPNWLSPTHMLEIKGGNKPAVAVRATIQARNEAVRNVKVTLTKLKFMGEK